MADLPYQFLGLFSSGAVFLPTQFLWVGYSVLTSILLA
jgi:hypothetical protein